MPASQLGWAWQLEKNRGKAATRRRGPAGTKKAEVKSLGFFVSEIIAAFASKLLSTKKLRQRSAIPRWLGQVSGLSFRVGAISACCEFGLSGNP